MPTSEEKTWGTIAHIGSLIISLAGGMGWIVSLVIYLVYKEKSRFIAYQALQQLMFQGVCFVLFWIGILFTMTVIGIIIGIPLMIIVALANIYFSIVAAIAVNKGDAYSMPVVARWAKNALP